jgi:hypothetical protein
MWTDKEEFEIQLDYFINIKRYILISQECKIVEINNTYDCSLCYETHIFICVVTNIFYKGQKFYLKSKCKCNFCVKSWQFFRLYCDVHHVYCVLEQVEACLQVVVMFSEVYAFKV